MKGEAFQKLMWMGVGSELSHKHTSHHILDVVMIHTKILVLLSSIRYGHSPLRRSISLGLNAVFMLGLCHITMINQSYRLIWTPSNGKKGGNGPAYLSPTLQWTGRTSGTSCHLPLVNLFTSSASPLCPCGLGSMKIRVGGSEDKGGWAAAFLQAGFYLKGCVTL